MNNLFKKLAFISVCATAANFAQATDPISSTIDVTADVITNCTIKGGSLAVTGYDSIVTHKTDALDQKTTFKIACTKDSAVTVALAKDALKTENGTELEYNLFQDESRSEPWDAASNKRTVRGSGVEETETIYVRVPAGQNKPAGTYTAAITATVEF